MNPIKTITLKDGTKRYRFTVDVGRKPDGRRDQRTFTFKTLKDARAERARMTSDRARGTLVRPSKATLQEAVSTWLAGKRNLKDSTRRTYADALRLATDRLGHVPIQRLTKGRIDDLVSELLTSGRRVGTVQRKGLSPRSVNLMLTLLAAVLESEKRQGHVATNVAKMAERPSQPRPEIRTWTANQAATFLAFTSTDRLAAAWQLSLYGLRRGEVLGLRWSDVDLVGKTITIRNTRTSVAGVMVEDEPKTPAGRRTLPLDDELLDSLTRLQLRQWEERDKVGEAYQSKCPLCGEPHVVADELGQPYRPEWYGDRFDALTKAAKLPAIRLHDTRHTCASVMLLRGAFIADVSKWLGHTKTSFTVDTYVHAQGDALREAGKTLRTAYTLDATVRP